MKQSIVVLFLQLVFGYFCSSTIFVYNLTNQLGEFQDYSTDIGPSVPMAGMKGRYVYLQMEDSCSPNIPPAPKNHTISWFALIDLNYSCYYVQILNIQSSGYALAILSKTIDDEDDDDNNKQNLQSLPGDDNDHSKNGSVSIPSTVISNKTKMHLITYSGMPNITMYVYPEYHDINRFMLILLGTLCLAIVVALLLFLLIYGCYRVYRIRKSIITKWRLKFLPTYVLQKGDLYEVCVICLDEYMEGAKLRILSCGHAFHRKCVDPWLIKSGCECPLCKRKADLGRGGNKRSTGGGDDDERTALLGDEARDNYDDDGDDNENPVRLIPEMQTTINAIVHPVDTPQRRNYGTIVGGHSSHNSTAAPLVLDTNPPEQSTATFYIGSVIADDDVILVGDHRREVVAPPQPAVRLHGDSDEESEEDFYDVRNEYHV